MRRNEQVILVTTECTTSKLLPTFYDPSQVDAIDAFASLPHASTSALGTTTIDLKEVERALLEKIGARTGKGKKKVSVVLDSLDLLVESESGTTGLIKLLRKVLKASENLRLIALHHASFPSPPSTSTAASTTSPLVSSLINILLSPNISLTTIHLILHPSKILETLSREYGLSIPLNPTVPPDLRLYSFLTAFAARSYGSPFVTPDSSDDVDERIAMDVGGKEEGGCVVEWSARGVTSVVGEASKKGEQRRIIQRGFEGLKKVKGALVAPVGLREVLKKEEMVSIVLAPNSAVTPASTSQNSDIPLPFNLSLTDSQRAAREGVVLPYLPKESGVGSGGGGGGGGGGGIEYVPDEGDDMDDDDPDEDLEV